LHSEIVLLKVAPHPKFFEHATKNEKKLLFSLGGFLKAFSSDPVVLASLMAPHISRGKMVAKLK
jgi:hypothetical protein